MPTYLLDENVHHPGDIIARCAEAGVEVIRVHQLGLDSADDKLIFEHAMQAGYVLVTGNVRDFRPLQQAWIEAGRGFPGIIYLSANRYRSVEAIIQRIVEVEQQYFPGGEWWVSG